MKRLVDNVSKDSSKLASPNFLGSKTITPYFRPRVTSLLSNLRIRQFGELDMSNPRSYYLFRFTSFSSSEFS